MEVLKFSIITVSYNSSCTIANTVRSVCMQNYGNYEHLIMDGGSDDDTLNVVKNFMNPKLFLVSEKDAGMYDAMNKGVQRASGEIIGILNSDDFYVHNNVLNEVATVFLSDSTLDVVFGDVDFVKNEDLETPVRTYRASGFKTWMFRFGFMPPHPAVFVRKTAYERVGCYKMGYKIAADYDFLLRLMLVDGARYKATGRRWVRMLTGGASTSGWRSNFVITREIQQSLHENNIFSNLPMVLLRLPVKFFRQINLCK